MEGKNKKTQWFCRECKTPTTEPDKVCVVCSSGETAIRRLVSKRKLREK